MMCFNNKSEHLSGTLQSLLVTKQQVWPGLNANEIQIPYDKHHKVSSSVNSHQNTYSSVKYEVI